MEPSVGQPAVRAQELLDIYRSRAVHLESNHVINAWGKPRPPSPNGDA